MEQRKRLIEVFTAGCSVCAPAVDLVKKLTCSSCEVIVYNLAEPCDPNECLRKALDYGVKSLPAIAVNGILLPSYQSSGISEKELLNAGIGNQITR